MSTENANNGLDPVESQDPIGSENSALEPELIQEQFPFAKAGENDLYTDLETSASSVISAEEPESTDTAAADVLQETFFFAEDEDASVTSLEENKPSDILQEEPIYSEDERIPEPQVAVFPTAEDGTDIYAQAALHPGRSRAILTISFVRSGFRSRRSGSSETRRSGCSVRKRCLSSVIAAQWITEPT